MLAIDLDIGDVVLKNGRDVDLYRQVSAMEKKKKILALVERGWLARGLDEPERGRLLLTSGKVPLEKTLENSEINYQYCSFVPTCLVKMQSRCCCFGGGGYVGLTSRDKSYHKHRRQR